MRNTESILESTFDDLEDALADFESSAFQNAESVLCRYLHVLDSEPLAGFLGSILPTGDFEQWWENASGTGSSMVGSGSLHWPPERASRVGLQIDLCRSLVSGDIKFINFVHEFCYPGYNSLSAHVQRFAEVVLSPLTRDIQRLAENRPLPPFLLDAMGNLPTSGDAKLDNMLTEACRKFRDTAPAARKEAVERLWDAWERIKSLDESDNKRISVGILLDGAATEPQFREILEAEARALTEIGNNFHIRHFEKNRTEITSTAHYDYLFHRLFALIHLLIFSRIDDVA